MSEFLWLPSEEESAPVEGMTNFHALIETGGEPPGVGPESFDVAQIVYTSGTESRPKGVQLTHDAILWQYVSCMVDASIAGDDVAVHALPLYHCAQLDVFLGPSIYAGGVNVVTAKPVPDNIFRLIERERATSFFAPPTVWISMLRSPALRRRGPVEPAQGLLRRLDHAGRGHARDGAADAEGAALEPLRPDRDRPARHHARARGSVAQARLLRPAGAQRRDARGRRLRCAT